MGSQTKSTSTLLILAKPAIHFVVLGAVVFALSGIDTRPHNRTTAPREITLDASQLRNRPADELIEEEILVREALAAGLDRDERIVEARLGAIGGFLELDPEAGAAELAAKARALGLHKTDSIVRRHLASLMRLYLSQLRAADWPSEADLEAYLAAHSTELASASRTHLTHVFLRRERRGDPLNEEVARLYDELIRGRIAPEAVAHLGDPFARGSREMVASAAQLDETFGPGFAAAISQLAPATWSSPVESVYGKHLVWIHERLPGGPPRLAEVRSRVLHRVLADRREARFRQRFATLRSRYQVRTVWN